MPSKEWTALRTTFVACAPKTIADLVAANPGIDLRGVEGIYSLAAEPTDVTYEEVGSAGSQAIWANPLRSDTDRVIAYFHGGGFVSGSKDTHRKIAAHLAKAAGCRALIPDYRLAPEHTFPAQLDDARALYDWLFSQGFQPSKIAFAGDSAGANIATAAALALKRDNRPLPGAIVAFSPWYDMEANGATFDSNAAKDVAISRQLVQTYGPMFLGGQSPTDPLANPMYTDPAGLPPIFVTCGGHETLRDSIERFAALARQAGVDVVLHVEEGMPHAYQLMAGRLPEADASIAEAGKWLRSRLDRVTPTSERGGRDPDLVHPERGEPHDVCDLHPTGRSRRFVRSAGHACLPRTGRRTRFRQRLDRRAGAGHTPNVESAGEWLERG